MEIRTIKYWKGKLIENSTVEVPDDVQELENVSVFMGELFANCPYCKKRLNDREITDQSENKCQKITDHYYKHLSCSGIFRTYF